MDRPWVKQCLVQYALGEVWPVQPATRPKVVNYPGPSQVMPQQYPVQRPVQAPPQQYSVRQPVQMPPQQQYAPRGPAYLPQQQYPVQAQTQQGPYAYSSGPQQQQTPIYDQSYGATQPYATYTVIRKSPQRQTQQGLIGDLYESGLEMGEVIQGYLPAAVRGGPSPYDVAPGSGVVSEFFVPGTP